jgi:predicted Ser/Thr protein kinase/Zn finger protein HypA/HybF involved in hydrogenase expression
MPSPQDLLIGRIALANRMITREQLDQCLSIQEKAPAPVALGEVFVQQGVLSKDQVERLLVAQRKLRMSSGDMPSVQREREALFGRMVVKKGLATEEQVNACLREQELDAGQRLHRNLGQMLVDKGILTRDQVRQVLAEQQKVIVTCTGCGARFNAPSLTNLPRCPKCGGELAAPPQGASLPVIASIRADGRTDSLIGREVGGCKILEFVGRGSMGTVYKARHLALNKSVAIKAMPIRDANRESLIRYEHEARSLAKLEHRNIVHVYNVGNAEGVCFIVMQYIQGRPLGALMADGAGVQPRDALHYAREIAQGLAAAHAKRLVHRDLKPDNVLVTAAKEVFITDFGLAQDVEFEKAGEGRRLIVGTPYYIAPEQWRAEKVDGRADLYSLGVILYTMLAGKRPFDAMRIDEMMKHHLQTPPPALRTTDEITEGICAVVEKLLVKDPKNRYQKAEELIQDLLRIERGEDPLALGDFGPTIQCDFCDALNPQNARRCKVCNEELAGGDAELELAPLENEFKCANCGSVQPKQDKGIARCGKCQVEFCSVCRVKVAVIQGLCAECLAAGVKPAAKVAPKRRLRRRF